MTAYSIGMVLGRPVGLGIVTHYGIVVAVDPEVRIVESQVAFGVQEVPFGEFASGRPVTIKDLSSGFCPDEVAFRARYLVGKVPYHPVHANCETVMRYVLTGEATSLQADIGKLASNLLLFATGSPMLLAVHDMATAGQSNFPPIPRMPGAKVAKLRQLVALDRLWRRQTGKPHPQIKRTQKNRVNAVLAK